MFNLSCSAGRTGNQP